MRKKITRILSYFEELFPDAKCELIYKSDYELALAVMLSAQTTDKKVNFVTQKLFVAYPSLNDLSIASLTSVEQIIKPLGMSNRKALYTIGIARTLLNKFSGKVPSDRDLLMSLPGVGNKTANVIRVELFKLPELPVDTHVMRIAKRLDLVSENDGPSEIEKKLKKIVPKEEQISTHHRMIHFGRYFCKALSPNCAQCKIKDLCNYQKKK